PQAPDVRAYQLAVHARVIASERAGADHGHTDSSLRHQRAAPISDIPGEDTPSSPAPCGGSAWIAIPAASANSIRRTRSNRSVRFASIASAVACAAFVRWIVRY